MLALLAMLALGACTTAAPPLTAEAPSFAFDKDEQDLLRTAAGVDTLLRSKGLLLADPAVTAYVQAVGQRLVPPAAARALTFRFQVLRDPMVNAFALPNGSIYLNVGLLARLENEAQLASVLGHEVAHIVARHALERARSRRTTLLAASIADTVLLGTSIAYAPALAVLAGHSREAEAAADRLGIEYLSAAGYPIDEMQRLFVVMQTVKPRESQLGSIYSSHPDNQQRSAQAREIIAGSKLARNAEGPLRAREFLAVRQSLVLEDIRLKLNIRHYRLAAQSAERGLEQAPSSAWLHYYRGESYRLMAFDPEGAARENAWIEGAEMSKALITEFRGKKQALLGTAKQAFADAHAADGQLAESHRGLGLVAFAEGDAPTARAELQRYLDTGKDIKDRRYIDSILGRLAKP